MVHDFGAFDEEMGVVTGSFTLINSGKTPLTILAARANCGCTIPAFSRKPVMPGDTATLSVGFDPKGRPGKFSKFITVDIDDGNGEAQRVKLEITGTVIGASNTLRSRFPIDAGTFKLRTSLMAFNEVLKGKTKAASIAAINASHDTITPEITCTPGYIRAVVSPEIVPPGQTFVIQGMMDSHELNDWGPIVDTIRVNATDITVTAVIREDFSLLTQDDLAKAPIARLSAQVLDLTSLNSGKLTVTNPGKSPLMIRTLKSADTNLVIHAKKMEIPAGGSLDITVRPLKREGEINSRILIITNDPLHPSQSVRVVRL